MRPATRQHITLRLRCELLKEIDRLVSQGQATDDRLSRSEIIETAIRRYLETACSPARHLVAQA